jgi:hypothetical protein
MAPRRPGLALIAAAIAAAVAGYASADASTVDPALVRAQPCSRAGIATALMGHFGLMEERRFAALAGIWLPKARLPDYAYVLFVTVNGRTLRTKSGAQIPRLAAQWMSSGGERAGVVAVDAYPAPKEPRRSGFAVWWIRQSDGDVVLGAGKGVWDCEQHRLGRIVGSERTATSEAAARADARSHCGRRGSTLLLRFGQLAALCNAATRR